MTTPKQKTLNLSPSQIDSYMLCPRKWWYKSFIKMPEPPSKATTLGDVGHNVLGRFLEGQDLYPEGWHIARNRWTGKPQGDPLSPNEQALVKALIHNGIHSGTVAREPDGVVEQEIKLDVDCFKRPVQIRMFLDYATQHSVQDHKFCKSTRYYSKGKLAKAVPMLFYALAQWESGNCKDDAIWLRYNLFVKNPNDPATKTVEVEVMKKQVASWYEHTMLPVIGEIVDLAERAEREDWHRVHGAEDKQSACTAYGGCPFLPICSGQKTMDEYRESHGEVNEDARRKQEDALLEGLRQAGTKTGKEEDKNMTFREKMLAAKKGEPVEETTTAAPEAEETTTTTAPEQPATDQPAAPWWNETCAACKSNPVLGYSSKGKTCAVCTTLNKRMGREVNAAEYQTVTNEDGSMMILDKDGEVVLDTAAPEVREAREVVVPAEKEKVEVEEPAAKEKKKTAEPPKAKAKAKPEVKEESETETDDDGPTGEFDPERMTFTLSYVAVRQKKRTSRKLGDANCVVHIAELMEMAAVKLAASTGAPEYYELNAFARRDLIAANGKAIALLLGNSILEADTVQRATDEAHVCAALERYASVVYGSMA